ncbi:fructosamine kinase family protein [Streptomyces actuosus]|uniref:Fructosamine kinase family protein n=1 Tax=Streptomyces actuosus TaxID=1885 RepID=A0ABS2VKX7_STRAS|nr:fructosamine kinase family protein [Streptomyces actuosus]MBN0043733.1 fructosamine kinase family protein [Streptomyces actuosus]
MRNSSDGSPDGGPAAAAARFTGSAVTGARHRSATLTEVTVDGGRAVMVKHGDAGAVRAEAAGLRWLADAGAVPVPVVHGHDERWLVTDRVPAGRPGPDAAVRFGRSLAALHAAGAPAFGAPPPGGPEDAWIGLAPMRNTAVDDDWPHWYAEHRVLPYLRRAVDDGTLRAAEASVVEQVCARLPELAGPAEPPARLHGDLWNGNVLWGADGRVWLIDPAAHGGHRETDLAMLELFGCPHLDRILEGYGETHPPAAGRRDRIGVHQLFPLLVHAVLFGRGYAEQALSAARGALAL